MIITTRFKLDITKKLILKIGFIFYIGGARTWRNVEEHETEEKEAGQSSTTTKNHYSNGRYLTIQLLYTVLRKNLLYQD